ncbi:unnamed protein product [Jaminaea pallidilutea]
MAASWCSSAPRWTTCHSLGAIRRGQPERVGACAHLCLQCDCSWVGQRGQWDKGESGKNARLSFGPYHFDPYHSKRSPAPLSSILCRQPIIFLCNECSITIVCCWDCVSQVLLFSIVSAFVLVDRRRLLFSSIAVIFLFSFMVGAFLSIVLCSRRSSAPLCMATKAALRLPSRRIGMPFGTYHTLSSMHHPRCPCFALHSLDALA